MDIKVWEDNWIHSKLAHPATGNGASIYPHLRVQELFKTGTREWDEHLIRELMTQEDAQYVLNIRPSISDKPDIPIWCFSTKGDYNVKSGYNLQKQISQQQSRQQHETQNLTSEEMKSCCSRLWKLYFLSKIKIFWWRAIHDGLPVADNLKRRGLKVDDVCQLCGDAEETVLHLLFQCRVSKEIWSLAPSLFQNHQGDQFSLIQNIDMMINQVKDDRRNLLNFLVGWRIWKMKNKLVFEQQREHIVQVVHAAVRDYQQWKKASDQKDDGRSDPNVSSISTATAPMLPQTQSCYCLVDASWKNPIENGGIGWSLFSKESIQQICGSSMIKPTNSASEAEATTLLMAVQQMKRL